MPSFSKSSNDENSSITVWVVPLQQNKAKIYPLGVRWGNYTTLRQNHECTSYKVLSADCRWSRLNRTLSHNSAASVGQTSTARHWHNLLMMRPQWHLPVNHSHVKQQSQKYCKNNVGNTAKSNNFFCTSNSVCLLTLCALQMMVLLLLQATIAFRAIVAWTVVYESPQSMCTGRWESPQSTCTARCTQLCGIQRPRLASPPTSHRSQGRHTQTTISQPQLRRPYKARTSMAHRRTLGIISMWSEILSVNSTHRRYQSHNLCQSVGSFCA